MQPSTNGVPQGITGWLCELLALRGERHAELPRLLAEALPLFSLTDLLVVWPLGEPAALRVAVGEQKLTSADVPDELAVAGTIEEIRRSGETFALPLIREGFSNGAWVCRTAAPPDEAMLAQWKLAAQSLAASTIWRASLPPHADRGYLAERLKDAAVVSGKLAHDFDNVFTGVVGFGEMIQMAAQPGSQIANYIREVMNAGARGMKFTKQLHDLSRSGQSRGMPTLPQMVLSKEATRVKTAFPNVRFEFPTGEIPAVGLEAAALQLVLGHLIDNAAEASPDGATVTIEADTPTLSQWEADRYFGQVRSGPCVCIRVKDRGPGVKADYRNRLFMDSFITTKPLHRGLGLVIAHRILHANGGGVRLESSMPPITIFTVVLPLTATSRAG